MEKKPQVTKCACGKPDHCNSGCPCVLTLYFKKDIPTSDDTKSSNDDVNTSSSCELTNVSPQGKSISSSPLGPTGITSPRPGSITPWRSKSGSSWWGSRSSVTGACRPRTQTMVDQFQRSLSEGEYLLWQLENSIRMLDTPHGDGQAGGSKKEPDDLLYGQTTPSQHARQAYNEVGSQTAIRQVESVECNQPVSRLRANRQPSSDTNHKQYSNTECRLPDSHTHNQPVSQSDTEIDSDKMQSEFDSIDETVRQLVSLSDMQPTSQETWQTSRQSYRQPSYQTVNQPGRSKVITTDIY